MLSNKWVWRIVLSTIVLGTIATFFWLLPYIRPVPSSLLDYAPPNDEKVSNPSTQESEDITYSAYLERMQREADAEAAVNSFRGRDARYAEALQPTIDALAKIEIAYKSGVYSANLHRLAKSADGELTLARGRVPQAQLSIAALQGAIWRYQEAANALDDENGKAEQSSKPADHFTTAYEMDKASHLIDRVMVFLGRD